MKPETATIRRPSTFGRVAVSLAALVGLTAMGMLPATAARADTNPDQLHLDSYLVSTLYGGVAVDIKALDTALVTNLDEVRVTVHRAVGAEVVKVSKSTGSVVSSLKAGNSVTAPIVITPGSYDEAGSSSWVQPDAVWSAETVPTELSVELLDAADAVLLSKTVGAPSTGPTGTTLDDVMPPAPAFTNPAANFHTGADYTGITVDVRVRDFTDAEQISVRVDREGAAPVVKTSKPALMATVNTGAAVSVSAPIVIQAGTYNEAGSSSWQAPGAVWTSSTVPTSVTVTIARTVGADVVTTIPIGGSIAGVMPAASAPVELELPSDAPLDVVIPEGAGEVSVKLGTPTHGVVTTPVDLTATSADGATLLIPAGTTVTAPDDANWDGVIQLPTVLTDVVVPTPAGAEKTTVGYAIQVGSTTTRLVFDSPVKLVLPGQVGSKAGFIEPGGAFTAITAVCPTATPSLASGACHLDDGDDLVIWTTHFTTFVAYGVTIAAAPGSGSLAATGFENGPLAGTAALLLLLGLGITVAVSMRRRRDARIPQ
jgi:hypothetical protein